MTALRLAIPVMALAAVVWFAYQGWRLLWQQGYWGAIDLRIYQRLIRGWFAGAPIYTLERSAIHPPATYVMLWPFFGWSSFTSARWLWALTTVAALTWLISLIIRESRVETPRERAFVALIPLSMYATGATIGNGQLIIHLLPVLVSGLIVLASERRGWRRELLGASLFLVTLVKPTVSAPFFWIVLFKAGKARAAMGIALGYVALTLFATSFQDSDTLTLLRQWVANPGLARQRGQSNVYSWLTDLGLQPWSSSVSMAVLAAHGVWTYRHRHVSLWVLIGVAALVARMWTYHAWYDDLLILLPMVTLLRVVKEEPSGGRARLAGALFAVSLAAMLAPGGLYLFPAPWNTVYTTGQVVVWAAILVFLIDRARNEHARTRTPSLA